ncbi:hypothetical protein SUGI_0042230 [Cryptomeria japonica]|uniref:uncharacterized protein LOC131049719 n=1 Tax=Cryptomeria japonica TaxID=3369 RepID=UPI002408D9E2|nr:uncharacterized protein LOC131049719 [Cryptomeria japonica]GLJ06571.1 hypothetical protein SUGI_0042230 [Cryptomeria japonica]
MELTSLSFAILSAYLYGGKALGMTYKMPVFPTLIVLLCMLVSEAANLEDERVCPALDYWNQKLPNTSVPNALRQSICPHTIADHQLEDVKAGDVSISSQKYIVPGGGDLTMYGHKYITPQVGDASISSHNYIPPQVADAFISSYNYIPFRGGDVTIYGHKYITPQVGDVSISTHNYIPPQEGDVTIYNHKYITPQVRDVSISSHKYIPLREGDATINSQKYITPQIGDISISSHNKYSHKYNQAIEKNPLHQRGDITLYNRKFIFNRDSSPQGDIILAKDPNQANVEYHRQLLAVDPLLSIFFFEKDLHIGTNMMVHLEVLKAQDLVGFLPRSMANKIPFSLEKLLVAQDMLNIPQGSRMSIIMEETLKKCESPAISGETRFCATSMESIVDYSTAKLGSNDLNVLVTNLPINFNSENHQYSVTALFAETNSSSKHVICHNLMYPYGIYMCHEAKGTEIFEISLSGPGTYGSSIPVKAICHADTSGWNPEHAAFVALNVKPGEEGICHFMLEGTIAWLLAN